jgi:hypothetical protein
MSQENELDDEAIENSIMAALRQSGLTEHSWSRIMQRITEAGATLEDIDNQLIDRLYGVNGTKKVLEREGYSYPLSMIWLLDFSSHGCLVSSLRVLRPLQEGTESEREAYRSVTVYG